MTRGPCTFRQQDVTRAIKAAVAAGAKLARVEIDKSGTIILVTGEPAETHEAPKPDNEWEVP